MFFSTQNKKSCMIWAWIMDWKCCTWAVQATQLIENSSINNNYLMAHVNSPREYFIRRDNSNMTSKYIIIYCNLSLAKLLNIFEFVVRKFHFWTALRRNRGIILHLLKFLGRRTTCHRLLRSWLTRQWVAHLSKPLQYTTPVPVSPRHKCTVLLTPHFTK